jgi:hypothetical protein
MSGRQPFDQEAYVRSITRATANASWTIGAALLTMAVVEIFCSWLPDWLIGLFSLSILTTATVIYNANKAWFPWALLWFVFLPFTAASIIFGPGILIFSPSGILSGAGGFILSMIFCYWPKLPPQYHFLVPTISLIIWSICAPIAYAWIRNDAQRTAAFEARHSQKAHDEPVI